MSVAACLPLHAISTLNFQIHRLLWFFPFRLNLLKGMEFLSAVLGLLPCLYDHASKRTVYIRDLETNLQALGKERAKLSALYQDVKARVEDAEQRQMMRTKEVGGWMCGVEEMEKQVAEILQSGENEIRRRCVRCCPRNCWSSYTIGKLVSEKLVAVSDQIGQGHFDVVAHRLPGPPVDELPLPEMVGAESVYDTICRFLKDPQVGIVGLYGIGGVGKTTLLKKINNEFLAQSNDFDVVIFVVVSKSPSVEKMQKEIWNKLKIPLDVWETKSCQESRAAKILRVLKGKRFALLLDDIWERLDLHEMVGIPLPNPQNQSKIVLTTRSQDVCRDMKAAKSIEVACLDSNAAWTLFRKEVGEEALNSHPDIPRLAQEVVEECRGLPLALLTLGRAMAAETDPLSWERAAQDLKKFPAAISGMENELFHRLKLSYDRLSDDVLKSCFLYCSIFPEDYGINHSYLIELWIGKGILGMIDDIHEAQDQGEKIIKTLKHACLLEPCGSRGKRVKLHDVIRDMALWLYGEYGAKKNKVLLYEGTDMPYDDLQAFKLKETEIISLWEINIKEFDQVLVCPNLNTLIVTNCTELKNFSNGIFQFLPFLRVLDLSGNVNLSEVPPGIGKLTALTYLNLSSTSIKELPIELKQLKNLMIFRLDVIDSVVNIPQDLISSLISLKLLDIYGTKISSEIEEILFEELESLDGLSEIRISIYSARSLNILMSSHKLLRCLSYVKFCELRNVILLEMSSSFLKRTRHLSQLVISRVDELEDLKINDEITYTHNNMARPNKIAMREKYFRSLKTVFVSYCPKLLNLTWLVYLPSVENLYIEECESLKEIIQDDGRVYEIGEKLGMFSRLRHLYLSSVPMLKSIYWRPLPLPSLESIKVYDCESLRRLPFDSNTSTNNLKKIKGGTSWWNRLEWTEESVKHSFTRYFEMHESDDASSTDSEDSAADSTDGMEEELKGN